MSSEQGDYVGNGINSYFGEDAGTFLVFRADPSTVQIGFRSPDSENVWFLSFDAPDHDALAVGHYENATLFPFNSAGRPGLSVFGNGRSSNQIAGNFEIKEITWDGDDLLSFWATFEQRGDGSPHALRGEIRYHLGATPSPALLATGTAVTGHGKKDRKKPQLKVYGSLKRVTTGARLLVGGFVSDNGRVSSLEIKKKGKRFQRVPAKGYWATSIDLDPGQNVFWIRATDAAGNRTQVRLVATRTP